jgi:hypothetical protein
VITVELEVVMTVLPNLDAIWQGRLSEIAVNPTPPLVVYYLC